MGHKVFIPVTDELIFDRPELISAPLRPYCENLACYHWLDVRLNPEEDVLPVNNIQKLGGQGAERESDYRPAFAA